MDRHLTLEFTDAAKDWLAERGYDPVYGARPLKRAVQSNIETVLARKIIGGEIHDGEHIGIDVDGGGLVFVPAQKQQSQDRAQDRAPDRDPDQGRRKAAGA